MELSPTLKKTADKYIKQNKDKYIAKGKKDGLAEGRAEGRAEGKKAGFLETAKNLLKLGLSLDKISEATTLSIEEIKALSAQMA